MGQEQQGGGKNKCVEVIRHNVCVFKTTVAKGKRASTQSEQGGGRKAKKGSKRGLCVGEERTLARDGDSC